MEKKLSIGIFVDTFFPMIDGVVVAVDNYATILAKNNDVTVFAPRAKKHKNYTIEKPYKIIRCHTIKIPLIEYELSLPIVDSAFRKAIRKSHFDVIHIHSPFTIGKNGVDYARKHKVPVFATFHSQYRQDFYVRTKFKFFSDVMIKAIMKLFNKVDLAFAVNNKVDQVYKNEYGSTVKTVVRNNGTDLVLFEDKSQIEELKTKYDVKADEKILLFVGRIDKVKNIYFIAQVLKMLKERNFKFKMLFIGKGYDEENLKVKIRKLGLEKEVMFLGKISEREEIAMHYAIADLFVFPSLYDSSSLVQIEAASQKTPSIFIEGAVTADTVTNDFNGYTAENDIVKFTDRILEIFDNPDHYNEVCENAYKTLYKKWDDVVAQTYEDYLTYIEMNQQKKALMLKNYDKRSL